MKQITVLAIISCLTSQVFGQTHETSDYSIFSLAEDLPAKLKKAKSISDLRHFKGDKAYWFFLDSSDAVSFLSISNPSNFVDTVTTLSDVPCDCMIRNDTAYLQGGIAYGGGIGFDVRIVNQSFNGHIWIAGEGFKTAAMTEYRKEVHLRSVKQALMIENPHSLKSGKTIVGELVLESEPFIKKGEQKANKYYMKILFSCKLDEHTVF